MQIDPKGLEAAIEAAHDAWTNGCEHEADDLGLRHAVPAAIRAYLSALSPAMLVDMGSGRRWMTPALSPAGTASEMEPVGWQPIETAPRDGTTILMGKFHDGDFYWMASGRIEDGQFWCDFPDEFFVPFSHQNPTHWMPLPAPPKAGE